MATEIVGQTKTCSCCNLEKPTSEFFKASCCKDGLRGECKTCVAEKQRAYNTENAEKISAKKKEAYHAEGNKARMTERRAAYYISSRERIKSAAREYRAENAAKISEKRKSMLGKLREQKAAWNARNKERARETGRTWYAKNKDRLKPNRKAAKALRRAAGSTDRHTVESLLRAQRGRCACCKKVAGFGSPYHLDHIVPVARGGTNERGNLQILCPSCNLQKSAKDPIDFMQSRGFLL
jgi:5-methylcytosine-specific restriction endonuclease McrA